MQESGPPVKKPPRSPYVAACMPGRRVLVLDLTSGRFHGASIAGLAVGAMGVFVFAVAFRHWLGGVKG